MSTQFLTISKAAEYLGVSIDTIRRWAKKGKLQEHRLDGKNRYFKISDLEELKFGDFLTVKEAAKRLRMSPSSLRRLSDSGVIKFSTSEAGYRLYKPSDLEGFVSKESKEELKAEAREASHLSFDEEFAARAGPSVRVRLLNLQKSIFRLSLVSRFTYYFLGVVVLGFVVSTLVITYSFLVDPRGTAEFFGFKYQTKNQNVLGVESAPFGEQVLGIASVVFKTPAEVGLKIAKSINPEAVDEVVAPESELEFIASTISEKVGLKGETGDTGPAGDAGLQGVKGEAGDKGDKGDKGDTGSTGEKGEKGDSGSFSGSYSATEGLQITAYGSAGGETTTLRFYELSGEEYVGFKAPDSIEESVVWSLPSSDGSSGQCISTDGSGNLSFASCSGGSGLTLNGLDGSTQTFSTGASGTDFNISSSGSNHTFNIPDASGIARGLVTTGTQTFAGSKAFTGSLDLGDGVEDELFIHAVTWEITNGASITLPTASNALVFDNNLLVLDTSNSRVGIGTTSPGAQLTIDASSSFEDPLSIKVSSGEALHMTSQGLIGIFNSNPDYDFDVDGVGRFAQGLRVENDAFVSGELGVGDETPDAKLEILSTGEQLRLTHTDGSVDTRFAVSSDGDLTINASADGTGSETLTLTGFSTLSTGLTAMNVAGGFYLGLGSGAGRIQFDDNSPDEVYIQDANFGIGTSDPGYKLHIAGSSNSGMFLEQGGSQSADADGFYNGLVFHSENSYAFGVNSNGDFELNYRDSGGIYNNLTVIQADSGYTGLGIGSGSVPNAKLEIRDSGGAGVLIDENGDGIALDIDSEATSADIINVDGTSLTTGIGLDLNNLNALTTGTGLRVYSNSSNTSTRNLVSIVNDHSSASGTTALYVQQDSSGYGAIFNGGNVGIGITAPATKLDIDSNSATQALRIRGLSEVGDVADLYVRAGGALVLSTENTVSASAYIEVEPEDGEYGLLIKDGGTGTTSFANFYVTDTTTDFLNVVLNADKNTVGLVIDDSDNVAIGDTTPDAKFEILGTGEQLRLTHTDGTVDARISVDSSGHLTISGSGDGTGSQTFTLSGYSALTASALTTLTTSSALTLSGATTLSTSLTAMTIADNFYLGLSSTAGRIEFDDQGTDEISFLNANVGIGDSAPDEALEVAGSIHASSAVYTSKKTFAYNPNAVTTKYTQYLGTFHVGRGPVDITIYDNGFGHGSGSFFRVTRHFGQNPVVHMQNTGLDGSAGSYTIHYRNVDEDSYELFFTDGDNSGGNSINYSAFINLKAAVESETLSAANDDNIDAATVALVTNYSGNVGIGQLVPTVKLHVGNSSITDSTNLLRLQDADSTCDFNANTGSPSCGSDLSLKKDVNSLDSGELLSKISGLRPVSYRWQTDSGSDPLQFGFIAQEVAQYFPDLVKDGQWVDGTTRKFLNMGGLMPYVVGAIKEQQVQISRLNEGSKILGVSTDKNYSEYGQEFDDLRKKIEDTRREIDNNKNYRFWEAVEDVAFSGMVKFEEATEFLANVVFKGKVTFSSDVASSVIVPEGVKKIKINFNKAFSEAPLVTLTPIKKITQDYALGEVTKEYFIIEFSDFTEEEITFNWTAFISEGPKGEVEVIESRMSEARDFTLKKQESSSSSFVEDDKAEEPRMDEGKMEGSDLKVEDGGEKESSISSNTDSQSTTLNPQSSPVQSTESAELTKD